MVLDVDVIHCSEQELSAKVLLLDTRKVFILPLFMVLILLWKEEVFGQLFGLSGV